MADVVLNAGPVDASTQIIDVWSRTAPKYRLRAVLMLLLLALLFAGLCCFTFWLRTGVYLPWEYPRYAGLMQHSFNPSGPDQITLSQFLSTPISVETVPIHSVIVGLLFASICSVPILVAILYRFPSSIIFSAMVCFLAAMPWLGLTVLGGCALASWPRFRFSFRFASALMGLMPVGIYFISASWEPAGSTQPIQNRALMYAPWVLAILSSCVICAVALAVAKLINYRPGGVAPVLALVFAIPMYLFHAQVGRDELEFRLLEQEIGPKSTTLFASIDVGAAAHREATRIWSGTSGVSYDAIYRQLLEEDESEALLRVESDRALAVIRCDSFLEHFPASRYASAVLFLKAQALDQRVQRAVLVAEHRIEFHNDMPSRASRTTWQAIVESFPDSPPAAVGMYKLAILDARGGRIDDAISLLSRLEDRFDLPKTTTQSAASPAVRLSVFQKADPVTGLGVNVKVIVMEARRLREMLTACREDAARPYNEIFVVPTTDPSSSRHPAQLLLSFDDTDPRYRANLVGLAEAFPGSNTADYVRVRLEQMQPAISLRILKFRQAAEELKGRPAGAEAMFRLAEVLQEDSLTGEARTVLTELIDLYPASCWAVEAGDRLSSLSMIDRAAS